MEKRFIATICLLFFALGGLFVTQGVTGMYALDFSQDDCDSDSDCIDTKVCCKFYDEDYGICADFSECAGISKATLEERQSFSVLKAPAESVQKGKLFDAVQSHVEQPKSGYSRNSVIVGLLLMVFAIAVYSFSSRHIQPPRHFSGLKAHKRRSRR